MGNKTYKYALTIVDVASRYKDVEPLTTKTAADVKQTLTKIYLAGISYPNLTQVTYPYLMQVDQGRELKGVI